MANKYIDVVAAVFVEGSEVYCFKRGNSKFEYLSNKFEFPGGKIERNEEKIDALKREIFEELNVEIKVLEELSEDEYQYPDFTVRISSFICQSLSPTFTLKEHVELIKVPIKNMHNLEWLPADIPSVNALKKWNNDKI